MNSERAQAFLADTALDSTISQDRAQRINLLRRVVMLVLVTCSIVLVGCIVALFLVEDFPIAPIIVDAIAILSLLVVTVLLSRGHLVLALPLGMISLTVIQFAAMYYVNGSLGPLAILTPVIIMIAGVVGERGYAQPAVLGHITFYLVFVILEAVGVLAPNQLPVLAARIAWVVVFVLATVMMVIINREFVGSLAISLAASLQREEALAEMGERLQSAAAAERETQTQASENARQLQEVAREYVTYLERIAAGHYSASLDLDALAEKSHLPQELLRLGEYINTTVASLLAALDEAQRAQQTYTRQSWEGLMQARRTPGGYHYRAAEAADVPELEVDEKAWLSPMTQTVRSRDVTVGTQELALPIASGARAQLIGALGVRREQSESWSEDELALATTVTDQLAQTLENLRLLDETTRRAAREQMAGEITGHIREAVEIEAVLERALSELGRAFAAERGTAYLALSEQEEAQ